MSAGGGAAAARGGSGRRGPAGALGGCQPEGACGAGGASASAGSASASAGSASVSAGSASASAGGAGASNRGGGFAPGARGGSHPSMQRIVATARAFGGTQGAEDDAAARVQAPPVMPRPTEKTGSDARRAVRRRGPRRAARRP